jgi:hypothetical protein
MAEKRKKSSAWQIVSVILISVALLQAIVGFIKYYNEHNIKIINGTRTMSLSDWVGVKNPIRYAIGDPSWPNTWIALINKDKSKKLKDQISYSTLSLYDFKSNLSDLQTKLDTLLVSEKGHISTIPRSKLTSFIDSNKYSRENECFYYYNGTYNIIDSAMPAIYSYSIVKCFKSDSGYQCVDLTSIYLKGIQKELLPEAIREQSRIFNNIIILNDKPIKQQTYKK